MAVALTLGEYNDLLVRSALLEHRRVISTPQSPREPIPHGEIPGRFGATLEDPHKHRRSEGGLYDGRTGPEARRGGRPPIYPSKRQAQAAAARAYRARLRVRLAPEAGSR
jgi:hypothetical protein